MINYLISESLIDLVVLLSMHNWFRYCS